MNEEIKIEGNSIQIGNKVCYCLDKDLIYYITKLQQDLDKSNDIIEKDRQFYKCRMDEYAELKKENERLKEIIKDNTILVKDKNGNYQECNINPLDYKSRCEKAIEELTYMSTDAYTDNYDIRDKHYNLLMNLLNGSDEK